MITLVCGKDKLVVHESKAQSILYIQKQMKVKGWELSKDSPYQFIGNALIKRTDTKDCKGEKKLKRDSARKKTPRAAEVSHRDDSKQE